MRLSKVPLLRRVILPLLKLLDRDIEIQHSWLSQKRMAISLFKHKGYWYHGKTREKETMLMFEKLIRPGWTVVEVGGHVGFISLWFEYLAGANGRVFVFEPGSNNLPYIKKNISESKCITLIEKAVGSSVGKVSFYEDSLTGQNNSLVKDFSGYKVNANFSHVSSEIEEKSVPLTMLDTEFQGTRVDFVKIDIEGGEFGAMQGASRMLAESQPAFMVEIQANEEELFELFWKNEYELIDPRGRKLTSPDALRGNVFCFHSVKHADFIRSIESERQI